jgi:hypothetical protein
VLALVGLTRVDPGDRRAQTVNGGSHVVKEGGILTIKNLGSNDPGVGLQGGFDHASHSGTAQGQVVAQKQVETPGGRGSMVSEGKVGGCPKGRGGVGGDHACVGEDGGHPFVDRPTPCVHDQYPEIAVVLGG